MKCISKLFIISMVFFVMPVFANEQGFRGIVPLKSDCEDVKRILQVEKCTFPQSIYRLKNFNVVVNFTTDKPSKEDKICFKVPAGLVSSLTISYHKSFPLSEFEYEVKYIEGPFGDINTTVYGDKEKGIRVFTIDGHVSYVGYIPTEMEYQKLSYLCKSSDAGDDIELPSNWFDRYWNLPPKKEKTRIRDITPIIKKTEENFQRSMQVYLVYYYNHKEDEKSGFEQATRAKKYLEIYGINSKKIKIINGGKEDKSEIVIYLVNSK